MPNLKRSDLKNSFLKQIIIRLDFNGVLDQDVGDAIIAMRTDLHRAGYINYTEIKGSNLNFEIHRDQNEVSLKNGDKSTVYQFSDENKSKVEISKSFIIVTDQFEYYRGIDNYFTIFNIALKAMSSNNLYFSPKRLGLRKINACFFHDVNLIPKYFNELIFPDAGLQEIYAPINFINSEKKYSFKGESHNLNVRSSIQSGTMRADEKEETLFRTILDFDAYIMASETLTHALSSPEESRAFFIALNSSLFQSYAKSLSSDFLDELKTEHFQSNEILGVTQNERR